MSVQFGRYELLERIGVGGMAEVWKSRVAGIGGFEKILVVKKILPAFASNKTFIEMLLAEARLCGLLHHTNIVQTYENGEIDGQYYIAMEYVSGYDLFKVLSRATQVGRRLPVELCLYIAAEVAKGLAYAHNAKDTRGNPLHIIHRDVSPSNVLISEAGEVKVMDFGVARATMGGPKRDGESRAGVLKGKLGYMSPEQVTGQPFDARSDIFSLGIILYESITLKRLFLGRTDLETLVNIRDARIEHKFRKHSYIEEAVRAVLRMALARSADERYDNALDMHDDIINLLFELKIQVTNRSLAAFLAELFDDEGGADAEVGAQRLRKAAVADDMKREQDVLDEQQLRRQADEIRRKNEQVRSATERDGEAGEDTNRGANTFAEMPTDVHARALPGVDAIESERVAAPTAGAGRPDQASADGANDLVDISDTLRRSVTDKATRAMLRETLSDANPPDFSLGEELAAYLRNDVETKPTSLRESKLRPVPLSAEPRERPSSQQSHAAILSSDGRFTVKTSHDEVIGPLNREKVGDLIRERRVGIGAEVAVEGGAFRPVEEVSELRDLLATVVPVREPPGRQGVTSRTEFPSLVFELCTERVTGCLELREGEAVKFIYLRRGRPQHINSNQKNEQLAEFLKTQGLVSQDDIDAALAHIERSGGRLGDALVGVNAIKPFQLYQLLEKQFHARFIDAFGWDGAEYAFYAGDKPPEEAVPLDLDPIAMLAEAARAKLTFALLEPHLKSSLDKQLYRARDAAISVAELRFQARETKALQQLMSSTTLRQALNEKCRNRQQRLAMMQVAYLMLLTGLLTFDSGA